MDITPPKAFSEAEIGEIGGTPAPQRARMAAYDKQISQLVREKGNLSRKLQAQELEFNVKLQALQAEMTKTKKELGRCKLEGEDMREELNMFTVLAQQKAVLALAQEQMQIVELEHRLVQTEQQRVMRDFKITLFQNREAELLVEAEEREARIVDLESSLERSANNANSSLTDTNRALELKVKKLEESVNVWKSKEKEAQGQLENWLRDEKGKGNDSDKEIRELKTQLRKVKFEVEKKENEISDLQDEVRSLKTNGKEREKELKAKLQKAQEASSRRAAASDSEREIPVVKRAKPSVKSPLKSTKRSKPESDSDTATETVQPARKSPRKAKAPLVESSSVINKPSNAVESVKKASPAKVEKPAKEATKMIAPKITVSNPVEDDATGGGEKKKKRKLFGGMQPAFKWDPIMESAGGVIPSTLSPLKIGNTGSIPIPRLGFGNSASSRSLGRI